MTTTTSAAVLSSELKAPVLLLLAKVLPADGWRDNTLVGMSLCRLLRSRGFDEKYFGVLHLSDILVSLIEEAQQN